MYRFWAEYRTTVSSTFQLGSSVFRCSGGLWLVPLPVQALSAINNFIQVALVLMVFLGPSHVEDSAYIAFCTLRRFNWKSGCDLNFKVRLTWVLGGDLASARPWAAFSERCYGNRIAGVLARAVWIVWIVGSFEFRWTPFRLWVLMSELLTSFLVPCLSRGPIYV